MPMKNTFLKMTLPLALVFILSASAVRGQTGSIEVPTAEDIMKMFVTFLFGEEFPASWLTWNGFMQNIIFPFLAIFIVMYGILSEIRIFREVKVKAILALIMAFVAGSGVCGAVA